MTRSWDIDFEHDSLADILMKQQECMEFYQDRLLRLGAENRILQEKLREGGDTAQEFTRMEDAINKIDVWLFGGALDGFQQVDVHALREVMADALCYAMNGKKPPWWDAANSQAQRDYKIDNGEEVEE